LLKHAIKVYLKSANLQPPQQICLSLLREKLRHVLCFEVSYGVLSDALLSWTSWARASLFINSYTSNMSFCNRTQPPALVPAGHKCSLRTQLSYSVRTSTRRLGSERESQRCERSMTTEGHQTQTTQVCKDGEGTGSRVQSYRGSARTNSTGPMDPTSRTKPR
jgi:hypothetical protein